MRHSTEGNVVNALDGLNPTKLLLGAIEHAGISASLNAFRMSGEDDTFGLAIVSSTGEVRLFVFASRFIVMTVNGRFCGLTKLLLAIPLIVRAVYH